MALEIERKFLVTGDDWKVPGRGLHVRQGYLSTVAERTVRVRIAGHRAFLTIKGKSVGICRAEFEYPIPVDEAEEMLLTLCEQPIIDKHRYRVPHGGLVWEVDDFHGANEGLVVAEVELESADQRVSPPTWIGDEVTDDPRYFNAALVANPYSTW